MSTRGAIARQKGDTFEGRYHHWDSYPTGLGKALWELSHNQFKGDIEGMLHVLIDEHPAGWSTIVGKNFSLAKGFNELDKWKCLTCGKTLREHYPKTNTCSFVREHQTNAECYCHGDRSEDALLVTEKNAADMGCEYVYVVSIPAAGRTNGVMTVLSSINDDGSKMIGMFGMGNPEAKWGVLAVVRLDGPEPDWEALERGQAIQ